MQAELTDDGTVRVYPDNAPYILRDQSMRNADDMVRVVIGDVGDVLRAAGYADEAKKAEKLYNEACALWEDDDGDETSLNFDYGWLDTSKDPDASEKIRWILEEAENLPHVFVNWDGENGTVFTSISDLWEEITEEEAEARGIDF